MTSQTGEAAKRIAVDALRKALLDGDLVAGQRLIEPDLAEALGVSRSSIRAALIDLAADGLVERVPNKGARVRVVPLEEAIAINECRMVLDGLCAAKAAERATAAETEELRALGRQLSGAVEDGEPLKFSSLNIELHRAIRRISGHTVATGLLERLHEQVTRHQFRLALQPQGPQTWLPEHLAIIEAIARHDPAAAESAARAHMANIIAVLRASADQQP